MDQGPLVEDHIADGKRFLELLAEEGITVAAACWIKESDSGHWYLYIASSLVGEGGGTLDAYGRIYPLIRQMPQPSWVDFFNVKAIGAHSPIAEAVLALQRRSPGKKHLRLGECRLGNESADGAYIYPPIPVPVR